MEKYLAGRRAGLRYGDLPEGDHELPGQNLMAKKGGTWLLPRQIALMRDSVERLGV